MISFNGKKDSLIYIYTIQSREKLEIQSTYKKSTVELSK